LILRRELNYPPFSTLVKLSFTAKTSAKVNFESEKLYEKLLATFRGAKIATERSEDSTLYSLFSTQTSPPYESYAKTPGKAQINIAVKTKPENLDALAKLAKVVPPEWKVEVGPESLL